MQYTTERLRLRPLGMEDTDAVWELVSDEAIGGQLYYGVQRTREEAARLSGRPRPAALCGTGGGERRLCRCAGAAAVRAGSL